MRGTASLSIAASSFRRNVASCGSAHDPARGLQLITGVWPRRGRLAIARTAPSGELASAISFCTRRNRSARSPCLTTVSSLGHVQILTRTSVDRRLTFILRRSILLVSLWLSWPLTSVLHRMRRPSDTSPSGHAARNTRTTARFVAWSLNAGTSARALG